MFDKKYVKHLYLRQDFATNSIITTDVKYNIENSKNIKNIIELKVRNLIKLNSSIKVIDLIGLLMQLSQILIRDILTLLEATPDQKRHVACSYCSKKLSYISKVICQKCNVCTMFKTFYSTHHYTLTNFQTCTIHWQ